MNEKNKKNIRKNVMQALLKKKERIPKNLESN